MLSTLKRPATLWIIAIIALIAVGSVASANSLLTSALWIAASLATAALTFTASRACSQSGQRVWRFITLGLALMAVSRALTTFVAPNVNHQLTGVPADLLMVIAYAALVTSAVIILKVSHANRDVAAVLDGLIVVIASGLLASHFIVASVWDGQFSTGRLLWSQLAHIVIDLALVGVAVRLWFSTSEAAQRATRWIAIGMVLLGLGDLLTVAVRSTPELSNLRWLVLANVSDAMFLLLVGLAALSGSRDRFTNASPMRGLRSPARTILMLLIVLATPIVILISDRSRGGDLDSALLGPVTAILFALVAARIWLLVRAFNTAALRNLITAQVHSEHAASRSDLMMLVPLWVGRITGRTDLTCTVTSAPTTSPALSTPTAAVFALGRDSSDTRLVIESSRPLSEADHEALTDLGAALTDQLERIALRTSLINLAAESRASQLLANSADAIVVLDRDLKIHYATPRFNEFSGLVNGGVGLPLNEVLPSDAAAVLTGLLDNSHGHDEARVALTLEADSDQVRHCDAIAVWLQDEARYVLTIRDVSEHQQLRAELAQRAFYDQLTGLANRELFRERLLEAIQRRERYGVPFAVLVLDLDDFKSVNDTLGHPAGDHLLRQVADRIRDVLRAGDTAARLGGDEFALIVEGASTSAEAGIVADRLLVGLRAPMLVEGCDLSPQASIGIALSSDGVTSTELERNADLALYDAKGSGKGRWSAFHSDLHSEAMARLALASQLRDALQRNEIIPCYQPIVDLITGSVIGIEALARWVNPDRGVLLPADFMFAAHDSGALIDIGTTILNQSVRDLAQLDKLLEGYPPLTVSVNMSTRHMQEANIGSAIQHTLNEYDIAPHRLILEITESALLPGKGVTAERLEAFRALGIRLYLDDFGTGWSSLGYLRNLPVSGLKLAEDFVQSLPNERDRGLIAAVRTLADTLSLEPVIAEGIETEAQRHTLVCAGYQLGQGHLFAEPMAFDELVDYLTRTPTGASSQGVRDAESSPSESADSVAESPVAAALVPVVEG